jgi:flagellar biosynthesis/type III secretory pathway protein FliH
MKIVQKYVELFAEKLQRTMNMQDAMVKAVWVAFKDGLEEGFQDGYSQGYAAALAEQGYDTAAIPDLAAKHSDSKMEAEWPEDDSRVDIIGQNGNTGEHYESTN